MKTLILFISLLLVPLFGICQVGIGTLTPTAELDIETSDTGIPALRLRPQSNPTGSNTGQLAVIGDLLYMYDNTRSKWLSVESAVFEWVYQDTDITNEFLTIDAEYKDKAEDVSQVMPLDGTIVYASINYTYVNGSTNKSFDIYFEDPTATAAATLNTSSEKTVLTNLNIDFNASDRIFIEYMGPDKIIDPVVMLWVKWRK